MHAKVHPSNLPDLSRLAGKHTSSLWRLQLFAEVCRLGFRYATVLPDIDRLHGKEVGGGQDQIQKYVAEQGETLFDLHNFASVRMWGILEAYVGDVSTFLIKTESARFSDKASKTRVPISLITNRSSGEYAEALISSLEQSVDASFKAGIGRFESVLGLLGASGAVDERVKDALFCCSKIRNCIVHNDSIIDSALATAIPELSENVGRRVGVTWLKAREFLYASCWYIVDIQERLIPAEARQEIKDQLRDAKENFLNRLDAVAENPASLPFPDPSLFGEAS